MSRSEVNVKCAGNDLKKGGIIITGTPEITVQNIVAHGSARIGLDMSPRQKKVADNQPRFENVSGWLI